MRRNEKKITREGGESTHPLDSRSRVKVVKKIRDKNLEHKKYRAKFFRLERTTGEDASEPHTKALELAACTLFVVVHT